VRTTFISVREKSTVGVRNASVKIIEKNIPPQRVKRTMFASVENARKNMHRNKELNLTFALEIVRIKIEEGKIRLNELIQNLTVSV